MIVVKDKQMRKIGKLENAHDINVERRVNELWTASFTLPINDDKNSLCKPLHYFEVYDKDNEYIGIFRLIPAKSRRLATLNEIQYSLEHVLSTLLNDILFRYHQRTNLTTRENIEYVLSRQSTKHWRLGDCDFTRYFHYKWENENGLLGALFSIAEPFDEPYIWTWDTRSYPWTLNLVRPETKPSCEIRYGKNLSEIEREVDPSNIVNRLYPLGAGEGVNQLTIEKVNGGLPYIENKSSIAEYGFLAYVWVDRRFEDVESLFASAKKFLDEWSVPKVTYRIKALDLSKLSGISVDKLIAGKVVRIHDPDIGTVDARIVSDYRADIIENWHDVDLEISNKGEGIGTTLADIERRQEINEVYAQGATNIMNFTYQDNCDDQIPAIIPFYIDDDVVNINTCELTFRTKKFRAYSKATKGGGALVTSSKGGGGTTATSSSGGGSTATSSSGGGTSKSTESGGGSSQTSSSGGGTTATSSSSAPVSYELFTTTPYNIPTLPDYADHVHRVIINRNNQLHSHTVTVPNHTHSVTIPAHSHSFTVPNHTHDVVIPNHTHDVTIPDHTHEIELPDHTHEIEHGIYELDETPSKVTIKVDGNVVPHTTTSGDRINLVNYMSKDSDGKVSRGRHEVEILPDGLARIEGDLILRVFIQSQLGGNY